MKNNSPGIYQGFSNALQDYCSFPLPPFHADRSGLKPNIIKKKTNKKTKLFYSVVKEFGLNFKYEKYLNLIAIVGLVLKLECVSQSLDVQLLR